MNTANMLMMPITIMIPTENIISPSTYDRNNGTAYSILNSGYVTMYNGIDDGYSEIEFSYGMTSV